MTVFTRGKANPSSALLKEYGRTGWAPGMRAMVDGTEFQYVARFDGASAQVMDLSTGVTSIINLDRLQRPLLQTMARRDDEILRAIDGMLDSAPTSIPVNLFEAQVETGVGLRRAVVNLENYVTIDTSVREWIRTLPESVQEQLITRLGQLRPMELAELEAATTIASAAEVGTFTEGNLFLEEVLKVLGKDGLVVRDEGAMKIFVGNKDTVLKGLVFE